MARRYHFHLTDGREAIFDTDGERVNDTNGVWSHAERKAQDAMASCRGSLDWSDWIVDVHDAAGRRVMLLDFAEVREERMAA